MIKCGLVIGKFLPIHHGHIALIEFAASQCEEVILSMSYTPDDPIDPELRFEWITEIFKDSPAIKPAKVLDNFDDASLPLLIRTKIWAAFIKKTYPSCQILFSSEEYGELLAQHLGIEHGMFDLARKIVPVSATLIRQQPYVYWDFIPLVVRPYFVKKVCFYGPESTGKSVMAKWMAEKYQTEFVPEVAREIIVSNEFTLDDIVAVARAQYDRIQQKLKTANKILFCDTDAITTQIYSHHYLQCVPPEVAVCEEKITYDHYFLFAIDVPWVADGIRDLGEKRSEMFTVFKTALEERKIPYTLVQGTYEKREKIIDDVVRILLTAYSA